MTCPVCGRANIEAARFCSHCGGSLVGPSGQPGKPPGATGDLNLGVLYGMMVLLVLAVVFPPWETPPNDQPAFLGLHPFWSAPTPTAIISRMLLTIEAMTIVIGGIYVAWFFRAR